MTPYNFALKEYDPEGANVGDPGAIPANQNWNNLPPPTFDDDRWNLSQYGDAQIYGGDPSAGMFGGDDGGQPQPDMGGGGGSFQNILSQILGLGQTGGTSALTLPALAMALQQFRNSGQYLDYGREAAGMASPISQEERMRSLARYRAIEEDPNAYLDQSPLFQAALRQGMNTVERSNAAKGYLGSGEMLLALNREGQDRAAQFVQRDLDRIRQDAGFQFDPANAARFFMQGAQGKIDSENAAMGALGFAAQNYAQGGQPTGAGGNGLNFPRPGGGGGAAGGAGGAGGSAVQAIQAAIRAGMQINPNDPIVAAAIMEMTGGSTPWNAGGYADDLTYGDGSPIDMNGDGQIDYDEWTGWNNQDIMDQLTGGGMDFTPGMEEGAGYDWWNEDFDPNDVFDSFWTGD